MHMDLDTNMKLVGKRFPYLATYQVRVPLQFKIISLTHNTMQIGFSKDGMLNGIKVTVFTDCGWNPNDNYLSVAADHIDNGEYRYTV